MHLNTFFSNVRRLFEEILSYNSERVKVKGEMVSKKISKMNKREF